MLKRKINAQKLVHFDLLSYLCIRKNKNNLNPKSIRNYGKKNFNDWKRCKVHQCAW